LGRLPTAGELRLKRRSDADFPSWNTFGRFGTKVELAKIVRKHCEASAHLGSVVALCDDYLRAAHAHIEDDDLEADEVVIGFVYLIKSGRFYKIGNSNSAGRREYELSIQLPERAETVHLIRTDDPTGIKGY
jgi:predicted oxidoreductase